MTARERFVVAVVVNYDAADVTRHCVESLRRGSLPPNRILVADNASGSDEREALRLAFDSASDVEIRWLPENRHFAGGIAAGALRACELGATHLFFLNNDTEMEETCLERLVAAADAQPDAGIVGPALLDSGDRHPLSLGERYSTWSLAVPRTLLKVRSVGNGRPYRVGGIMGSAILVTRECFDRVGNYREDLLVYYEEVDYCLRARAKGFRPLLEPRAVVLHDGLRGFTAGMTPYAARLKTRNMLLLMRTHGGALDWLAFAPVYFGLVTASSALYAMRGNWPVVRAFWQGVGQGMHDSASGARA